MRIAPVLFTVASATSGSPVTRVVELIKALRGEIEKDGVAEQKTYDKFACWCEDTTARKAAAIDEAKDLIAQLSKEIVQNKGTIGTLQVDIKQLKSDIADNIKSQEEATAMRQKEHNTYATTRSDTEKATAALKSAIEVLTGAGEGRKSGSTLQQAQTLSVVAGVRSALRMLPKDALDADESETLRSFIKDPLHYGQAGFLQTNNNPFGDYAPASTQIQGILKNMYDTFITDLQNGGGEEGTKQKNFEELIQTKKDELASFEATLVQKTAFLGEQKKALADNKTNRANTEEQLKEDELFFADTKASCQQKADDWAERTRLRTEELGGIAQALKTLDSPEARATFESSATTFVQFSVENVNKERALNQIKAMAKKTHSLRLAALAAKLKTTGHFDGILATIDKMIVTLREEENDDIEHRDRCENLDNELAGNTDAAEHKKKNAQAKSERLASKSEELQKAIDKANTEIADQQKALDDALATRNDEHKEYIQALKDDEAAVGLLAKAITQMAAFYENNKKFLIQEPEYTHDEDVAPETFNKPYGGRKSESTGVLAILEMIKEDVQKEIGESKKMEAEAAREFEELRSAANKAMNALEQKVISLEQEKADTDQKNAQTKQNIENLDEVLNATGEERKAMEDDCDWIRTSFDSRRNKRMTEIEGLQTAKSFLLGARPDQTAGGH